MIFAGVKHNIREQAAKLKASAKQLPFATAKGLTATAKDAESKLTSALPKQLDRPTPFTMKAFAVEPATKQKLYAKVYVRPDQEKYLDFQIGGGVRTPARRALVIPKAVRLNQYGNMTKGALKKLMARPDVFSGKVDGVAGIYQRKGNKVTLLIGYAEQVRYKRRFPFEQIGRRAIRNGFDKNFAAAVAAAMATAK